MNEQMYIQWRDAKMQELLSKTSYDFNDLCDVVTILRGVGGCPWDREQDHHSIRKGMIEECYEVVEAIDRDDTALLREELGDVLLQIVFHSDIEKDAGNFDINDVANDECVKMIHRHPHVFGMVKADTSEQVLANWEMIKTEEKQRTSLSDQLHAIPPMLPALMRAQKVSKKMNADVTLSEQEMAACIIEDIDALAKSTDCEAQKRYMGQALFRLTSLCRRLGLEAEEALTQATEHMIGSVE